MLDFSGAVGTKITKKQRSPADRKTAPRDAWEAARQSKHRSTLVDSWVIPWERRQTPVSDDCWTA